VWTLNVYATSASLAYLASAVTKVDVSAVLLIGQPRPNVVSGEGVRISTAVGHR
jgi:hypothetical protein